MDVIRVRAPSAAHAERLIGALGGAYAVGLNGNRSGEVEVRLDGETATKLVELFNALGIWLSAGGLGTCEIGFGERTYTLLASNGAGPNDPTKFLLERAIQLQAALDSRIVIEQAKGILAERESISPDEAFTQLRRQARSRRIKLHAVCRELISTVGQLEGRDDGHRERRLRVSSYDG